MAHRELDMEKIKVVIADDSFVARSFLRQILEEDDEIEVIAEAENGKDALRLVKELKPNLVTMDLEMPVMDGLTAITEIMASCAVPILVVSTETTEKKNYAALALGALDAILKPQADISDMMEFISKVKLLSKVKVITHLRPHSGKVYHSVIKPKPKTLTDLNKNRVFAIASSTGGPQALAIILAGLPSDFPCPILIAQHISDGFALGMVNWLGSLCKLPVQLAKDGDFVVDGKIYLSPSEVNLTISSSRRIKLIPHLSKEIYRPSCNVLLNSVANVYGSQSVGIILSGMGRDGAMGMLEIHQAGGDTLAQDEGSSTIFGMNKVAIDMGAVQKILPVDKISPLMCCLAGLNASECVCLL